MYTYTWRVYTSYTRIIIRVYSSESESEREKENTSFDLVPILEALHLIFDFKSQFRFHRRLLLLQLRV